MADVIDYRRRPSSRRHLNMDRWLTTGGERRADDRSTGALGRDIPLISDGPWGARARVSRDAEKIAHL